MNDQADRSEPSDLWDPLGTLSQGPPQSGGSPGPPPGAFDDQPTTLVDLDQPGHGRVTKVPGRLAILGLGGLMLTGGTVFALTSAGGGGPESPEEAASALFDAIENEDALGVLGALDPAERDAIRDPMQQMVNELERLEVLDGSFDLGNISGFDIEFDGLAFEVESVRSDLARVHLSQGEASIAVDGEKIAVGDFVTDVLDEFDADLEELNASERTQLDTSSREFLVARETPDGWRVSLGYTAAELARDAVGGAAPAAGSGIAAQGADSPEAAVENMVRSAASFDFDALIAGFSSEMRPLREYSEFYADQLAEAERDAADGARIDVRDVQLEADENGSTALVQVTGFDISVEADGSSYDVKLDGQCLTITGDLEELGLDDSPFESGQVCMSDLDELSGDGFAGLERDLADEGIELPEFGPFNEVEVGIVAVRENGQWFVSPVRTTLDLGVKGLKALNREHLDAGVDFVRQLIDSFESGFSSSFDESFTTLEQDGGLGSSQTEPTFVPDFELDPIPIPEIDEQLGGGFDSGGVLTFEEQMKLVFGEDAGCIIGEVELLAPDLRDEIRSDSSANGQLSFEAGDALSEVLDICDVFAS